MTRIHGILATLLLGLFVGACGGEEGTTSYDALIRNNVLWESKNIENYEYRFQWVCFCPTERSMPVRITVEKDRITRVEAMEGNRELDRKQYKEYRTIDGLFELLADAYRRAESVRVEYDGTYGYPASAHIDYQTAVADEELGFSVSDFKPVESKTSP